MATLRKYKPRGYFRGGAVPVLDDMLIADDAPADGFPSEILGNAGESSPRVVENRNNGNGAEDQGGETSPPPDDNPLQRALDAQRRADELQQSTLDREIGKLPLSEFKKSFLRAHPDLITDEFRAKALGFHWNAALTAGIADDTPEMNAAILQGIDREIAHVRQQAIENVRMPPAEPEPEPIAEPEPTRNSAPPPLMPPPARRVPMSAPVSRGSHNTSTGKTQSDNTMTLTEEERVIARNSYSAPDMTDAQKEYAYALNKRRLKAMRESGEYRQTTEQSG